MQRDANHVAAYLCPGTPTTVQQVSTINGSIQNNLKHFLNPNFVSSSRNVSNAAGTATGFGNIPRNAFRGPFQQNWDFSVGKTFRFLERHQFRFRADFFNLFNHPVFRLPSLNTNAVEVGTPATFGQITETSLPARLIQFGLRYSF